MGEPLELTKRDEWAIQCMQRQLVVLDDLAARAADPRGWLALERQVHVLDDLTARAADTRAWLAVERQANSYARHLGTWLGREGVFPGARDRMSQHEADLAGYVDRAHAQVADVDPESLEAARSALGIRLAVIGKGGAGKTVIS